MKLRLIVLSLALLCLIAVVTGSFLYFSILKYRTPFIVVICLIFTVIIFTLASVAFLDLRERKKRRGSLVLQNAYLSALHETTLGLIGRLEFNELISAVLSRAGDLTGAQNGFLYLYNPEGDYLECLVGLGVYEDEVGWRVKPGEGFAGIIYETAETLIIEDYSAWPGKRPHQQRDNLHSVVGMPLKGDSSIFGVMGLGHLEADKFFGQDELDIIDRFCQLAVVALDNAQLYSRLQDELKQRHRAQEALKKANKELERLAGIDGLTQVANRRKFDKTLGEEWKRLARARAPIALIMGDVDFFKRYNDTYGHQAGDRCLQAVAQTLSANAYRPADMTARYGGEEFAVLLPDTDGEGARFVAERILTAVRNLQIPHASSRVASCVTVSLGVSCLTAERDVEPMRLVQLADKALYKAKKGGRNMAVLQASDHTAQPN